MNGIPAWPEFFTENGVLPQVQPTQGPDRQRQPNHERHNATIHAHPCDNCRHAARCGKMKLACMDFHRCLTSKKWKGGNNHTRNPTHSRYIKACRSET